MFDLFEFGPKFGIFHYAKLHSHKRVKWEWLAGPSLSNCQTIQPFSQYLLKWSNCVASLKGDKNLHFCPPKLEWTIFYCRTAICS